eukprot:1276748-Pyramimonas_sp.AAC.1
MKAPCFGESHSSPSRPELRALLEALCQRPHSQPWGVVRRGIRIEKTCAGGPEAEDLVERLVTRMPQVPVEPRQPLLGLHLLFL